MAKASAKTPNTAQQRMLAAREAGDVVRARQEAEALLKASPSEAEAAAARDVLDRTAVESGMWPYAGFAAAVIVTLILLAVVRT